MARIFRPVWAILTWLVILMIPVQFYLAGHGAFAFHDAAASAREDAWGAHALVGTLIGVAVLLALLAGFAARLPRRLLGLTGLLVVLMLVQMVLAGFGDSASTRWLAAVHPVNALILTGVAIMLVIRARAYLPRPLGGTGTTGGYLDERRLGDTVTVR
jgi:hypothetical protein